MSRKPDPAGLRTEQDADSDNEDAYGGGDGLDGVSRKEFVKFFAEHSAPVPNQLVEKT
ncbi:hypothetical protein [Rhodopseudomonas faecalis]|uniref:hypothetical protein n=1 Tax=Rhodopseudomonas faecalis TaxID=99655 RepID=UPI001FDEECE8|nr:hypothetical protein [Rhodopseudomonas faecalis]